MKLSKKRVLTMLASAVVLAGFSLVITPSANAGSNPNCANPAYHVHVAQDGTLTGDPNNAIDVFVSKTDANTPAGFNDLVKAAPNISGISMCSGNGTDSDDSTWTAVSDGSDGLKHQAASGVGISSSDFYAASTTVKPSASPSPTAKPTVKPTTKPTVKPAVKPTATKSSTSSGSGSGTTGLPVGAGTDLGRYSPASQNNPLALILGGLGLLGIAGGTTLLIKRSRA